jgi:hypothetical protein
LADAQGWAQQELEQAVGVVDSDLVRFTRSHGPLFWSESLSRLDPAVVTRITEQAVASNFVSDLGSALDLVEEAGLSVLAKLERRHNSEAGAFRGAAGDIAAGVAANATFALCRAAWLASVQALRDRSDRRSLRSYADMRDALARASRTAEDDEPNRAGDA